MITTHRPGSDRLILHVDATRIDAAVAMAFKEEARQIVQEEPGRIIIDIEQVEFLDSSGLGAIVAVMKMLGDGRKLELARPGDAVGKVLKLTRMDSVFVIHDDLQETPSSPGSRTAA